MSERRLGLVRINRTRAGTGALGTVVFVVFFLASMVVFVAEAYFLFMALVACGMISFMTGSHVLHLVRDCVTILYTTRHLTDEATQILDFANELEARQEETTDDTIAQEELYFRAHTPLAEHLNEFLAKKPTISTERILGYVRANFFNDCHESYTHYAHVLDFVAGLMPLFGLAGTVFGLILLLGSLKTGVSVEQLGPGLSTAMTTTLYGALLSISFKLLSSRFKNKRLSLEYDFSEFCAKMRFILGDRTA